MKYIDKYDVLIYFMVIVIMIIMFKEVTTYPYTIVNTILLIIIVFLAILTYFVKVRGLVYT